MGTGLLLTDKQRRTDRHNEDDSNVVQILPKHIKRKRYPNWKYRYVFKDQQNVLIIIK
jgi:hypothetical protein